MTLLHLDSPHKAKRKAGAIQKATCWKQGVKSRSRTGLKGPHPSLSWQRPPVGCLRAASGLEPWYKLAPGKDVWWSLRDVAREASCGRVAESGWASPLKRDCSAAD